MKQLGEDLGAVEWIETFLEAQETETEINGITPNQNAFENQGNNAQRR